MNLRKRLKIMLYEDAESDAELLELSMQESGLEFESLHAKNRKEFIDGLEKFQPDIILSDYGVPGFNGMQALEHLKEHKIDIPFVLVTGTLGEEKAVEMILAGASDFLLKDKPQNLHPAILRAINSVNERKAKRKAKEALRKSEAYFRSLIENNHDPILTLDNENIITYCSPNIKRILGYEADELQGKYLADLLHPEDQEKRDRSFDDLQAGRISRFITRIRVLKKNGESRWMEARISDYRSDDDISALVFNLRDIHEQVLADLQLKKKHALLDSVIQNLGEALIVIDVDRKVLFYNRIAERIMGLKLDNFVLPHKLSNLFGMFKPDGVTRYKEEELPIIRTLRGEVIQDEEMLFSKSNSHVNGRFLSINGRPLRDTSHGDVIAGILSFRDITEKKYYQMELENMLGMLERRVKERTAELLNAHKNLAQAHKLMTYSINYAKKIQQAILPSEEELHKMFKKSFMIFFPRDIVSGDFVWIHRNGSSSHLAIADCTGHGVPGAMMSMIGNELLDRIVVDRQIHQPEVVLDELDKTINGMLNKTDKLHTANDGMDIALCAFDFKNGILSFSGAHNDGLLVRDNNVLTLTASRRSIGGMISERYGDFIKVNIEIKPGDRLYLYTDGLSDQFGGPNEKKFTKRRLRELILDIQHYPMDKQREIILHKFNQWKGNQEQIDDVTLVGIEL